MIFIAYNVPYCLNFSAYFGVVQSDLSSSWCLISACQSHLTSDLHPYRRKRTFYVTVFPLLSTATDIKSFFSLKRRIWCTTQHCTDIAKLLHNLGMPLYEPKEWRLFIDSIKRSLNCVLLHNENWFASAPFVYSTTLIEKYETLKYLLEKIHCDQNEWLICVDLKMVNFCWDNSHQATLDAFCECGLVETLFIITPRTTGQCAKNWCLVERATNVINNPQVDREKILFPPLHIKLGLN